MYARNDPVTLACLLCPIQETRKEGSREATRMWKTCAELSRPEAVKILARSDLIGQFLFYLLEIKDTKYRIYSMHVTNGRPSLLLTPSLLLSVVGLIDYTCQLASTGCLRYCLLSPYHQVYTSLFNVNLGIFTNTGNLFET